MKKHFSRIFAVLLAVSLLFTQLLIPVSAETTKCTCDEDTRTGTIKAEYAANCTEYGYQVVTCDECGGIYNVYTDVPTGHDIVNKDAVAPTCTKSGYTAYEECAKCDYESGKEVVAALGHTFDTLVDEKLPTCSEEGYTCHKICSACGEHNDEYKPIDKLPHTFDGEPVIQEKAATCVADGYKKEVYTCTVCAKATKTVTLATYEKTGHNWELDEAASTPAVCMVSDGENVYKCTNEGCTQQPKKEKVAMPTEHDYSVVEYTATCTVAGEKIYTCKVCGTEGVREPIDALGHEWEKVEAKAPTCTEAGWDAYEYCTRCGESTFVEIPANDHKPTGETKVVKATCIAEGYTWNYCEGCDGYATDITAIDPLVHNNQVTIVERVEATCTKDGCTAEIKCDDCGKTLITSKVIKKLGHDTVSVEKKDSTCSEVGHEAYKYCTRCDYTTYKEIAKKPHQYIPTEGVVAPTCTEQGYTIKQCTECGNTVKEDYVDALGHELVSHEGKAATCTEDGFKAYETCAVCDYTTYEVIYATGHSIEAVEAQAPTCTEIGWDAYEYCTNEGCDHTTYVEIPANGHQYVHHDAKPATCTEPGYAAHDFCPVCGEDSSHVEIPALGHDYIDHDAHINCLETSWEAYQTCSRCDYTTYVEIPAKDSHQIVIDRGYMPTYDSTGLTNGEHCELCDYKVEQTVIAALEESVTFSYKATGINNSDVIVNSGYAYVNVYMNVNNVYDDAEDIARLWGINLNFKYDAENLTFVEIINNPEEAFENAITSKDPNGDIVIVLDMGQNGGVAKTFTEGEVLLATLKFKVDANFFNNTTAFELVADGSAVARGCSNTLDVDFGTGVEFDVAMLGDANGDNKINAEDTLALAEYFAAADDNYVAIFDMDKNGTINGDDFGYMRAAIVRDDTYLLVG